MNNLPNEIILGSAFCPPTIGHHAIVRALQKIENIDRIRLVPSGPRIDKVYAFQNDVRRKLIEIFVAEFADDRIVADFTFFDSQEQTTTLGMDQYYREKNGQSPIQVFGADVVKTMETWPNSPEDRRYLLEEMPKIFLSRSGVSLDLEGRGNYQLLETAIPEASSTAVREKGRLDLLTDRVRAEYQRLVLDQNR
jgi:nicotinic acid mononucleotide adenylyltransferase